MNSEKNIAAVIVGKLIYLGERGGGGGGLIIHMFFLSDQCFQIFSKKDYFVKFLSKWK